MLRAIGNKVPELSDELEMKIALAELLCFVGLAAAEIQTWHGELIAHATDNQNVRSWLIKRQSKCAVARHILRLLGTLEVRYHFRTVAFYIRTHHNITADWLSRETKKVVEDKMKLDGWAKVEAQESWEHYIEESVNGIFRWPGPGLSLALFRWHFCSFVSQVCHWSCPPFPLAARSVHVRSVSFICLPGLSRWCPPFSVGHAAFLRVCLPGLSLVAPPCSIPIHLSPRSVTAGGDALLCPSCLPSVSLLASLLVGHCARLGSLLVPFVSLLVLPSC